MTSLKSAARYVGTYHILQFALQDLQRHGLAPGLCYCSGAYHRPRKESTRFLDRRRSGSRHCPLALPTSVATRPSKQAWRLSLLHRFGNTQIYLVFRSLIRTFAPVMVQQIEITLKPKHRGFHLVTSEIVSQLPKLPKTGIVNIFTKHTSCGLSINENCDPDVRVDMETIFNRLVPENRPEYEHTLEGADDMPAHAKSTLSGVSITIPITDGRLNLGTWQGIYFCEFRNYGGSRELVVTIIGE